MRYRLRTLLIVLAIGPPVLAFSQNKLDPSEAIFGKWEIEEMVYRGKVQDMPFGWIDLGKDTFQMSNNLNPRLGEKYPCFIRPGEIDIHFDRRDVTRARYDLANGKLRIMWRNDGGSRPTNIDDPQKDARLTLYVLRRAQ